MAVAGQMPKEPQLTERVKAAMAKALRAAGVQIGFPSEDAVGERRGLQPARTGSIVEASARPLGVRHVVMRRDFF